MPKVTASLEFRGLDNQYLLHFTGDILINAIAKAAEAIDELAAAITLLANAESTNANMRSELTKIVSTFAAAIDPSDEDESQPG